MNKPLSTFEKRKLVEKIISHSKEWEREEYFRGDLYRQGNSAGNYSKFKDRETWNNIGLLYITGMEDTPILCETWECQTDAPSEDDGVWVSLKRVATQQDISDVNEW